MQDACGRNIDYLRISLTDRCNLRCLYCMPEEGVHSLSHDDILRKDEIIRAVRIFASCGIKHVRLTGGEPLIRKNILGVVDHIAHTPGITDVSLTTNGILLSKMAGALKGAGLSRINISLDTLDPDTYHYVTRLGNLQDALNGIAAAQAVGFNPIKINAVAVRSLNQDFYAFARMSMDAPLHIRFIEYMPVGQSQGFSGCGWGLDDVITAEEIIEIINTRAAAEGQALLAPATNAELPQGFGPARYWKFPGAAGTVGFISSISNHYCSTCNRVRLTADGKLRPCLFSDVEYDVRNALRNGTDDDVRQVFYAALANKPDEHHNKVGTERKMSQIGG